MSGNGRDTDPDLPLTPAAELRELISDAATARDELLLVLSEVRQAGAEAADRARGAAYDAGMDEVRRFTAFMAGEVGIAVQKFQATVNKVRGEVLRTIRPRMVMVDPATGWVTVQFDAELPVPEIGNGRHADRM